MPIKYDIDVINGVVYSTATGEIRAEDLLMHMKSLRNDAEFKPSMKELFDLKGTLMDLSATDTRRFAAQDNTDRDRLNNYMLAIVVPRELEYGMARMYQTLTEQYNPNISVFRDKQEAREWLGINSSKNPNHAD